MVLFFGLGMFFGYSYGTVFPYSWTPWLSIPPTIIFIIGFVSLPETPFFLMKSRQYEVKLLPFISEEIKYYNLKFLLFHRKLNVR